MIRSGAAYLVRLDFVEIPKGIPVEAEARIPILIL